MHTYALGDVMELVRRPVNVDPTATYREIGIRSFGRGIFHKSPVSGAQLGDKRVFDIRPGELVFSNVFAWEGAVAVTGESELGTIGSHRFMTYRVNPAIADIRYLCYFFQSEAGLSVVGSASPGSAGRNRTLGIKAFARHKIELPDVAIQRATAALLDASMTAIERAESARLKSRTKLLPLEDSAVHSIFPGIRGATWWLGRELPIVSGATPSTMEPSYWDGDVPWVTPADIGQQSGREISAGARFISDSGYASCSTSMLPVGSVVMTSRAPVGRLAIAASPICTNQGCKSFPPVPGLLPRYLYWALRYRMAQILDASRGTTFMEVSMKRLKGIDIPVPSMEEQRYIADYLDVIQGKVARAYSLIGKSDDYVKALRTSVLGSVFSGELV